MRLCVECHSPIPQARLDAIPNVRMCVRCTLKLGDVRRRSEPTWRGYASIGSLPSSTFADDGYYAATFSHKTSRKCMHSISQEHSVMGNALETGA